LDITWTPAEFLSCNNCQYPLASPSESMSYSIRVMDEVGCVDSAEVFVRIVQGDLTFTPQAFSPNGDNINDHFTIFAAPGYVQSISYLRVYDRWGVKVFDKQNFPPNIDTEGWDGRMGNNDSISGVYVFVGELILHDGTSLPLKGEMTLVR